MSDISFKQLHFSPPSTQTTAYRKKLKYFSLYYCFVFPKCTQHSSTAIPNTQTTHTHTQQHGQPHRKRLTKVRGVVYRHP